MWLGRRSSHSQWNHLAPAIERHSRAEMTDVRAKSKIDLPIKSPFNERSRARGRDPRSTRSSPPVNCASRAFQRVFPTFFTATARRDGEELFRLKERKKRAAAHFTRILQSRNPGAKYNLRHDISWSYSLHKGSGEKDGACTIEIVRVEDANRVATRVKVKSPRKKLALTPRFPSCTPTETIDEA